MQVLGIASIAVLFALAARAQDNITPSDGHTCDLDGTATSKDNEE